MGNILGREKPLKEVLRENKRMINRAIREIDREKNGLEREEKRLTLEIKKAAKENQMQAVKIMAKVSVTYNTCCKQTGIIHSRSDKAAFRAKKTFLQFVVLFILS